MKPVILAHGFIGYRRFLFWSMFEGVDEALRKEGILAFRPRVHPTASIEERAHQLKKFIDETLGPKEPFHFIGHSMGGLDGRFLASPGGMDLGHRILTLTTLSTPHYGSPLAPRIPEWPRKVISFSSRVGRYFFRGEQRSYLDDLAQWDWRGLAQLTPDYLQNEFNPRILDHPVVRYFSYAGKVDFSQTSLKNFFRRPAWKFLWDQSGDNDGMVPVTSAQWGEFRGILACDHGAMVGLRVIPWMKLEFDFIAFFVHWARDLAAMETELLKKR